MKFKDALKTIIEAELAEIPKLKQDQLTPPPENIDNELKSKKENENIKVNNDQEDTEEDNKKEEIDKYNEKDHEAIRDKLIDKFNEENENESNIILKPYDLGNNKKCFIVVLDIDEPYFDEQKYETGEIELKLNNIFYNDLKSICSDIGVKKITWKKNNDIKYGEISLV